MNNETKTQPGTPSAFPLATGSASELLVQWRAAMDKRREACLNAPHHSSDWEAMDYQIRFTLEDTKALLLMTGKLLERVAELERHQPNPAGQPRRDSDVGL